MLSERRSNVPTILLTISDGKSQDDVKVVMESIKNMKGVNCFSASLKPTGNDE